MKQFFSRLGFEDIEYKGIFYSVLIVKIIICCVFISELHSDLFSPFLDFFLQSNFNNPYQYYFEINETERFPYPALMLFILSLPKLLFGWLSDATFFHAFLIKLPLIIFDLSIYFILKSWILQENQLKLILLYWCSPVLIFISYIHGQLDVIPIGLLFISLNYLFKNKIFESAIFLGLAISAKTVSLIVIPFFLLYLIKSNSFTKNLFYFIASFIGCFLVINAAYLSSTGFLQMVFNNSEQLRIFDLKINIGLISILIIPLSYLLLTFRGFTIKRFNKDVFNMFLGFSFGIILIFVTPNEGWYFWVLPFLFYFYAKASRYSYLLVLLLQLMYFCYFWIDGISEISNDFKTLAIFSESSLLLLKDIIFTLLQATLIINCIWIYQFGISSYTKYKISSMPFLLGIGGDSGSGKSTFASAIKTVFGENLVTIINGDDMHRWERGHNAWKEFTHLNPKANQLHNEIMMLENLKQQKAIFRKKYNHDTGKFDKEELFIPKNIIVYEGLHPFYLSKQREAFDLKIFIEPNEDLRKKWKIQRDTSIRGKSEPEVIKQISDRTNDSESYIKIQSKKADILLKPFLDKDDQIGFKINLSNSIFMEEILDDLNQYSDISIEHTYEDTETQSIKLSGKIFEDDLKKLEKKYIKGFYELDIDKVNWPESCFGLVLFITSVVIFDLAKNESSRSY